MIEFTRHQRQQGGPVQPDHLDTARHSRLAAVVLIVVRRAMWRGETSRGTADGKPDLSGYYDTATITPMQRGAQ